MISKSDIESAYKNIKSEVHKTPLMYALELSKRSKAEVYLKMENLQHSGSFKVRGVLNKMKTLSTHELKKKLIAASTGNHAAAFAFAQERYNFKGVLFLPENANKTKLNALKESDLEIYSIGKNSVETEKEARRFADQINGVLIHPYNDVDIIKGQGTIAVEITEQLPNVDVVFVPIGGGGLASGISSYFSENKKIEVIGCQPKNASEMYTSIRENRIVSPSTLKTIADGAAGGIEEDAITFDICKTNISNFEIVSEEDIKKAMAFVLKFHNFEIEPTAAISIAALLKGNKYKGKKVVLALTGSKIEPQLLSEIKSQYGNYY